MQVRTTTTTTTLRPTKPPTTTTVEPPAEPAPQSLRSRFRTKAQAQDSPPANQFVSEVAETPVSDHRPVYKELTSRYL